MSARPRPQEDAVIPWLLEGDPAIRWQVLRDLVGAPSRTVTRERQRIAREGWGQRLLAEQGASGTWAATRSSDGLYTPKWVSTTYTMLLLRDCGLPPKSDAVRNACTQLLDRGIQPDGGINYGTWSKWTRRSETCITGMVLSILSYFEHRDARVDTLSEHLLEQQMPDGGWNCRRAGGATHSSMHTTISALEGLRWYETFRDGAKRRVRLAQKRGREFLLAHRLFRSDRTGAVIKSEFTRLTFPPRWHYDILRALDYFREVDAPRDERLADAIEVLIEKRSDDGRWPLQYRYTGKTYFDMERVGAPSRWNTLRALRVLKWWNRGATSRRR